MKVWDLRKNYSSSKSHLPRPYLTFETVRQGGEYFFPVVFSRYEGYVILFCVMQLVSHALWQIQISAFSMAPARMESKLQLECWGILLTSICLLFSIYKYRADGSVTKPSTSG